jgi:hypothetical protein
MRVAPALKATPKTAVEFTASFFGPSHRSFVGEEQENEFGAKLASRDGFAQAATIVSWVLNVPRRKGSSGTFSAMRPFSGTLRTKPPSKLAYASLAPENPIQWLHELKAMTEDIAVSHNAANSLSGARKFNLQFNLFPVT